MFETAGLLEERQLWNKGMDLAKEAFMATASFPWDEEKSLRHEIREAAVAVTAHIARGQALPSDSEFLDAMYSARLGLAQMFTRFTTSCEEGYLSPRRGADLIQKVDEMQRLLFDEIQKRSSAGAVPSAGSPAPERVALAAG